MLSGYDGPRAIPACSQNFATCGTPGRTGDINEPFQHLMHRKMGGYTMPSLAPRRNAGQQLITPYICVLPSINCTCTYMHTRHTHTENDRTGSKATWRVLVYFPLLSIFCSVCADYIS